MISSLLPKNLFFKKMRNAVIAMMNAPIMSASPMILNTGVVPRNLSMMIPQSAATRATRDACTLLHQFNKDGRFLLNNLDVRLSSRGTGKKTVLQKACHCSSCKPDRGPLAGMRDQDPVMSIYSLTNRTNAVTLVRNAPLMNMVPTTVMKTDPDARPGKIIPAPAAPGATSMA